MADSQTIQAALIAKFGEAVVLQADHTALQPWIEIVPAQIAEVAAFLRTDERFYFDCLSCLSGVDYGVTAAKMGVVYHLYSIPYRTGIVLKCSLSREAPEVPTVSFVWRTADWHEREAYDLLGIVFTGHPDFRRIILPDDWEGYPLRKDYKPAETYHGVKITE